MTEHEYERHINGLKSIKPFMQSYFRTVDYEGLGELDATEVGETIDLAVAAMEAAQSSPKWISVSDGHPDLGTEPHWFKECLVTVRQIKTGETAVTLASYTRYKMGGRYRERWELDERSPSGWEITHWMPLPEPAKEENNVL